MVVQWRSSYIIKLFKLGIVEDEVHSSYFSKDGAITQGVSQRRQPWMDLCVCVCVFVGCCLATKTLNLNNTK